MNRVALRKAYVVALAMAMCGALQPAHAAPDWTVYLRRAGPVRIGASLDEARRAVGDRKATLKANAPRSPIDECAYLSSPALPDGLSVMFQRGAVVRIDVRLAGIRTASGIGLGSTEDDVRRAYGARIEMSPHKYTAGHYLTYRTVDDADRSLGMVFETDGARVTQFRVGRVEAVALVEGCS